MQKAEFLKAELENREHGSTCNMSKHPNLRKTIFHPEHNVSIPKFYQKVKRLVEGVEYQYFLVNYLDPRSTYDRESRKRPTKEWLACAAECR